METVNDTGAPGALAPGRLPLFCDTALAGRIERAEAQLITRCCEAARRRTGAEGFAIPVAGAVASFAGHESPFNKVAGLGFAGLPGSGGLDHIEAAFFACGSPVQVELAHLADPAIGALLTTRGYQLDAFENVLGRALAGGFQPVMPPELRPGSAVPMTSRLGLTSWLRGLSTPIRKGCPGTRSSRREQVHHLGVPVCRP